MASRQEHCCFFSFRVISNHYWFTNKQSYSVLEHWFVMTPLKNIVNIILPQQRYQMLKTTIKQHYTTSEISYR